MGYLAQYGAFSSYVWTAILAYSLQSIIKNLSWEVSIVREILYNVVGWGAALVTIIIMKTQLLDGDAVIICVKKLTSIENLVNF